MRLRSTRDQIRQYLPRVRRSFTKDIVQVDGPNQCQCNYGQRGCQHKREWPEKASYQDLTQEVYRRRVVQRRAPGRATAERSFPQLAQRGIARSPTVPTVHGESHQRCGDRRNDRAAMPEITVIALQSRKHKRVSGRLCSFPPGSKAIPRTRLVEC
jgi:hypothetical protein